MSMSLLDLPSYNCFATAVKDICTREFTNFCKTALVMAKLWLNLRRIFDEYMIECNISVAFEMLFKVCITAWQFIWKCAVFEIYRSPLSAAHTLARWKNNLGRWTYRLSMDEPVNVSRLVELKFQGNSGGCSKTEEFRLNFYSTSLLILTGLSVNICKCSLCWCVGSRRWSKWIPNSLFGPRNLLSAPASTHQSTI